ncbi:MAG: hypothetical protein R2789_00975 [Microthrixaceae bacterium]
MIAVAVAAVVGVVISGFVAVPLHRFKELRPLTPRNVAAESGVTIRAVYRHAPPACHHDNSARDWPPVISVVRGCPVARSQRQAPRPGAAGPATSRWRSPPLCSIVCRIRPPT